MKKNILLLMLIFAGSALAADSYLKFNGVDQYVTVPDNAALNFGTGDFSICFWANIKNIASEPMLLYSFHEEIDTWWSVYVNKVGSFDCIGFYAKAEGVALDPQGFLIAGGFALSGWHLITVTMDRDSLICMYIDGQLSAGTPNVGGAGVNLSTEAPMVIGGGFDGEFFLQGALDDIRIYKKALSQADVSRIYNLAVGTKLTGDEVGLSWGSNCDNAAGNTLTDITGTVNGTLANSVANNMWQTGGVPFQISPPVWGMRYMGTKGRYAK